MIFLFKQVIFRFHVSFRGYNIWYLGSHPLVLSTATQDGRVYYYNRQAFNSQKSAAVFLCAETGTTIIHQKLNGTLPTDP